MDKGTGTAGKNRQKGGILMFRFADPIYFLLVIPVIGALWFIYRRKTVSAILFSATGRIPLKSRSWREFMSIATPLLFTAGLMLMVTALARPQTYFSKTHRTTDSIAIQMTVDMSGSMRALDMSPRTATGIDYKTRLDMVKKTFAEFVERRQDDMIGLVTFGGYATTRSPLTGDHQALLHVLKGVEVPQEAFDSNGRIINEEEMRTAIGDGLATACARLQNAAQKSRIIILLSDGESNTGLIKPEEAMQTAKKMGIKVYTIGIGSTGWAPIWGQNQFGQKTIARIPVTFDETLMKKIAADTGGLYFNVTDPDGLAKAMKEIDKLEKTKTDNEIYNQYNEMFPWFSTSGLALASFACFLNMLITKRMI